MLKSLNAARTSFGRAILRQTITQSRTFLTTPARRADLVQDLYVKAIGSHKPASVKASDADGHVQKFKLPATPTSPEETNLAEDLKTYDEQVVEVEGASAAGESTAAHEEDWFEKDFEEEVETAKGH